MRPKLTTRCPARNDCGVGNVIRAPRPFQRGELTVRPDERWRDGMPAPARALVTALTLPSLSRYG